MKPRRLRAQNFRTYPTLDLEFHEGLVGILGELRDAPEGANSNGSGKSSLLEAIEICLFGRRSLAGFLTRGGDVTELMLELTFEHAGDTYRIRRSYSARTKAGKTTVDFEILNDAPDLSMGPLGSLPMETWEPLTCESTKATDQLVVETIGLTRDTFRNSSYLRQGDGSYADPARDPKQRKDLLVEAALGRDPVWPKLVDAAKAARRVAQTELERISGETRSARELVDTRTDVEVEHAAAFIAEKEGERALEQAEKDLQTVTDRYLAAKDGAARRQTVEAELTTVTANLRGLQEKQAAAATAATALAGTRSQIAELSTAPDTSKIEARIAELETLVEKHREAQAAHELAARENERAQQSKAALMRRAGDSLQLAAAADEKGCALVHDEEAHCLTCGQTLPDEARARAIKSYVDEASGHKLAAERDTLEAEAVPLVLIPAAPAGDPPVAALDASRGQLRSAMESAAARAQLEERILQLMPQTKGPDENEIDDAAAAILVKTRELDEIEPVNLQAIETAGALCRANVTAARAALDVEKVKRARLDERLAAVTKAEEQLALAAARETELQVLVDEYLVVERACGRDGIPALIIENRAIPYIEAEATRILGELGTSFRVELRTQQALKSGDGLRDTLEVVVIDPDGNEADFAEGTSGGEQTRIGLALRIALARLLANRRGAESRLLALDEPSYLDAAGMTALLRVLRGLQAEFSSILLVSHVPELRDSLDEAIVVVKDGGRSRITGALVPDPVLDLAA